jgi:hypothetical protein
MAFQRKKTENGEGKKLRERGDSDKVLKAGPTEEREILPSDSARSLIN